MGTPKTIKTDNGPGYTSATFLNFCSRLSISLKTGIPYNPQSQGIIERAHQTLKHQLLRLKKGELYPLTPHNYLHHALFILNFLNLDSEGKTAAQQFWSPAAINKPFVTWKDPITNQWHGPDPVLIWGWGHVCVFPQDAEAPCWLPERLVCQIETVADCSNGEAADTREECSANKSATA